jgi:hypothetical protein
MFLLFDGDPLGCWPKHVTPEAIVPCGLGFMLRFFPAARGAVVVIANGMETMGVAVRPHVT